MCLLVQNMEPNIHNNGGELFLSCIMFGCVFSHMNISEVSLSLSNLWFNRICIEKTLKLWDGGSPI
jgi:hypothetical protein